MHRFVSMIIRLIIHIKQVVIELDSAHEYAHFFIGWGYYLLNDVEASKKKFSEIIKVNPKKMISLISFVD